MCPNPVAQAFRPEGFHSSIAIRADGWKNLTPEGVSYKPPYNSRKTFGNSCNPFNKISGLTARNRFSVGNGPSTAIARTPAARAISTSSGVSPT